MAAFKGLDQRLTREARVQVGERDGGVVQEGWGLTASAGGKPDAPFEPHRLSTQRRVDQPPHTQPEQVLRLVARSGGEIRGGSNELAQGLDFRIGGQLGRALQERRRRGDAAALLSAIRRLLKFCGDVFVGARCRRRQMPGSAVGLELGFGCVRERPMDSSPLRQRR